MKNKVVRFLIYWQCVIWIAQYLNILFLKFLIEFRRWKYSYIDWGIRRGILFVCQNYCNLNSSFLKRIFWSKFYSFIIDRDKSFCHFRLKWYSNRRSLRILKGRKSIEMLSIHHYFLIFWFFFSKLWWRIWCNN